MKTITALDEAKHSDSYTGLDYTIRRVTVLIEDIRSWRKSDGEPVVNFADRLAELNAELRGVQIHRELEAVRSGINESR